MSQITVDPSFRRPAPPAVVESPDGVLRARVDGEFAGVHLRADLSALDPDKVRFLRGDGSPVRSGDPSNGRNALCGWATGGVAYAYDAEAAPGDANVYYVQPLDKYGRPVGDRSAAVAVTVPWTAPSTSWVWVKNIADPSKSRRVLAATFNEDGRAFRSTFTPVPGARLGLSVGDVPGGLSATLALYTDTRAEYDDMLALFDGSVLLVQCHPDAGMPSFYARPSDSLTSTRLVEQGFGWSRRLWPVALTECRRPSTLDAPLLTPDPARRTGALREQYATYADLAAQVPSYDALMGWDPNYEGPVVPSFDVIDGGSAAFPGVGSNDSGEV